MTLSDHTVREYLESGRLQLDPFNADHLQGCSYDIHLGRGFVRYKTLDELGGIVPIIDPRRPNPDLMVTVQDDPFILASLGFVLAVTLEKIVIPDDLEVEVLGRSSVGRQGLIPVTAGYLDAGWYGYTTLEIVNFAPYPVALFPAMDIGQFVFRGLSTPADRPYGHEALGSRYQDQPARPVASIGGLQITVKHTPTPMAWSSYDRLP